MVDSTNDEGDKISECVDDCLIVIGLIRLITIDNYLKCTVISDPMIYIRQVE